MSRIALRGLLWGVERSIWSLEHVLSFFDNSYEKSNLLQGNNSPAFSRKPLRASTSRAEWNWFVASKAS